MSFRATTFCLLSTVAAAVLALAPAPAVAASTGQSVSGTSLGLLAITAVPTTFTTGFQPGSTATTTGLITATDTEPSWTLSVSDSSGSDPGHMQAAALGCSGSEQSLENPLSVEVTSVLGGVTSAGRVSISGSPQTVASSDDELLAETIFTANYAQTIEPTESLLLGCLYNTTATYTLQ